MSYRRALIMSLFVVAMCAPGQTLAQSAPAPLKVGQVTIAGSFRTRMESWDWFGDIPAGEYTYPGSILRVSASGSTKSIDWTGEVAFPFVLGLPTNAVGSGAQGPMGLGANYYVSNGNESNAADLFVKQAFVRFRNLAGVQSQTLKVGRFEFIDGAETAPKNATLAAIKRDRIAHRLIGNFGFSHVGRSVDGAQYALDRGTWNITALAARPTRGVFDVDGWSDLNINVFYGAATRRGGSAAHESEWRVFGIGYDDYRHGLVKVDNRPVSARRADSGSLAIGTIGGHYLRADRTAAGTVDLLLWASDQFGSWGTLSQRAYAFALEAGWQPDAKGAPWFRGGWDFGSGDGNPGDGTHGTFFQLLPTPRVYARLPFFNMMNLSDVFGEAIVRPSKIVTFRGDVHALRLADAADLWYQGGGAYQPTTFGYTGRPSNGNTPLATLVDASADITFSPHVTASGYFGCAFDRAVTDVIYGPGAGRLAYVELLVRF